LVFAASFQLVPGELSELVGDLVLALVAVVEGPFSDPGA
jgi:hypothetical protein